MSIPNVDEPAAPVLMTCAELIHQEELYIREYAVHYGIPSDLERGEMLERICTLHSGSGPVIPVLPHFTFERANGGRIRITGRKEPAGSSTHLPSNNVHARPSTNAPPSRRLVRAHAQLIPLNEPSSPEPNPDNVDVPEAGLAPAPELDTTSPEELDTTSPEELHIFTLPKELHPTKRFPTPSDTYSPSPSRDPSPAPGSPGARSGSESSSAALPKPRMEFVYPPKPRARSRRRGEDQNPDREFSPGPPWLERMLVDLQRGRGDVLEDLAEVKREAQEALYELTSARIALDKEQEKFKAMVDWMRTIVGEDKVNKLIAEATEYAEAHTSDEEEEDEEDTDGQGGEHDNEEHGSDDDGEDGGDGGDGNDDLRRTFRQPPSMKDAWREETDSESRRHNEVLAFYSQVDRPKASWLKRPFEELGADDDDDGWSTRSPPGPSKRPRTSPFSFNPRHTENSLSPTSVPPISTLDTTPSPSLKRRRADDGEESEEEVERSMRTSVGLESSRENLSRNAHKRPRSDAGSDAAPTSNDQLPLVLHSHLRRSSSESSASDVDSQGSDGEATEIIPFLEYEALDDEEDENDSFVPSDDDSLDSLEVDVAEDEIAIHADCTSSDEDQEGGHSNSAHDLRTILRFAIDEEGKGSWMWDAPRSRSPSLDIADYHKFVEGLEDEPPSHDSRSTGGTLRILGFNRPLQRASERIRPKAGGGVEIYKYDEGPEFQERLAREAEVVAEWKKVETRPPGHRTRGSLRETTREESNL